VEGLYQDYATRYVFDEIFEQRDFRSTYTPSDDQQRRTIKEFAGGCDVFILLPTGAGKSLCHATLPLQEISCDPLLLSPCYPAHSNMQFL